jgi:protein CpxP
MKNSSNKILTVAVVLLLLVNIALVVFMMQGRKKKGDKMHGKGEPFEMMVKELGMSEQQQTDYKAMKEEHMKSIRPLFDSVRSAKTAFFALTKQADVSDSLVNVYSQRITEKQSAIDKLTFAHFKRVRTIFTAEQQPKFDEFLQKMMQRKKDSAAKKEKD